MAYAELHSHSAYSFLEGADLPETLVAQAKKLGLAAVAILDVDGFYSAVQTAQAAKRYNMPVVYGAELTIEKHGRLPVLVDSQQGYHQLCNAISSHNLLHHGVRQPPWQLEDLAQYQQGNWRILTGTQHGPLQLALTAEGMPGAKRTLDLLCDHFGEDNIVVESCLRPDNAADLGPQLAHLAARRQLRLAATNASRCATAERQPLADVLAANRHGVPLSQAQPYLPPYGSFLRPESEMLTIHCARPDAVAAAGDLGAELSFDLTLLEPELPSSSVPKNHDDTSWLRTLTYRGARERYGARDSHTQAWNTIDHELRIIERLHFSGYFLIVKDIVDFCRSQNILCQGRGSAANSAVCYALGITAVDAVRHQLLFERFLSEGRRTPPDIDIDIESGRREEVIQYVYRKYGRENAAQVANTITYRPKAAIRAVGKALGYEEEVLKLWSRQVSRGRGSARNLEDTIIPDTVKDLAAQLQKMPQHMGIHPGGIVLTKSPVSQICPVGWAAKENRSVLQWDKDDCAAAGLVKFDLLGLGMLTALRHGFDWLSGEGIRGTDGQPLGLYNLPAEDSKVYDLLCAGESVGVFQVESRAQISTLPRLKPRAFYDLVIAVALIRPGPIQGKAVNPYLRRRNGEEEPTCHPVLRPILEKTLGVALFQEQLMRIAVEGAGFTAGEADNLRRVLSSKRHDEELARLRPKLDAGMKKRGLPKQTRKEIFASLRGFADFGFPESHAFSFAYLVYASAWLKVHYPEHFYAALLASQPMGFYTPASLLADARRHGVNIGAPSVVHSEQIAVPKPHIGESFPRSVLSTPLVENHLDLQIRLGLDSIKGLRQSTIRRILTERERGPWESLSDLTTRVGISTTDLELLSQAGALADLHVGRREGIWYAGQLASPHEWQPYIPGTEMGGKALDLPTMTEKEHLQADYERMRLSPTEHPVTFSRPDLQERGVITTRQLKDVEAGTVVELAGIITHRQRPGTARGVTFLSLEDEYGLANIVCTSGFWKRYVHVAISQNALIVKGRVEKKNGAESVRAQKIEPLELPISTRSRDFR